MFGSWRNQRTMQVALAALVVTEKKPSPLALYRCAKYAAPASEQIVKIVF